MNIRDLSLSAMRRCIGFVGDANEIFEGSIEENVWMGREHVTHKDVRWALGVSQLNEEIARLPEGLVFDVAANRFLHDMVRFLVGTMLDVASGKRPKEDFTALLVADRNDEVSPPVPPVGLCLEEVTYPADLYLTPS